MCYNIKIMNVQAKTTCFIQEQKGEIIKLENILYDRPYFSIDTTHTKLFRHSFWCIDNVRDAN
jgi:hypothetical protein